MVAVGYAVMPVIPSFDNISRQIDKRISGPLSKASKQAGEGIEKGVGSGVDAAADRVEKANYRVKKSAEELKDAESKRSAELLKSQAAVKQLEAAESKLADMKKSGVASAEQLAKAEADVLNKRARAESAAQNVEKAERGVEKAMTESARASESLTKAQKELDSATDGAAESTGKFAKNADSADGAAGRFEGSLTKIVATAAAVTGAVVAAGKAAFDLGASFDDAYDTIRIGTGASGAAFEDLQNSMRNVARDSIGVGSDLGEIGTTLADLNTRLGVTGEPLEKLTAQFQQLKGMGMETDINAVSGAFQQFGVQSEQMPGMMDTLFQISQATGRSMSDLVGNLSKSGPALEQFGFGLTESAGLLGALDKAGLDADKTMMSMTKALGEFAKEGKNPQEALWGTIQQIDELTKAGKGMEALDLANKIFGAKGGAGFVAAVQSGQFAYEDFMESIGASGDTINGLAGETADFAEKWDQFKLRAMLALEPVAMAVFNALVPALESAWGAIEKATVKFQELGEWVQRNTEWLLPLAAAVGAAAGAWAAWNGVIAVWQGITKAATAVQAAFNAVMAANPIMLAVMAIAALVAGLTVFFTKTETGRQVWASFTEALAAGWQRLQDNLVVGFEVVRGAFSAVGSALVVAWNAVAAGFQAGWAVVSSVFNAFVTAGQWLVTILTTVVFTPLVLAWEAMSWAIQAAWANIIKPTWDALALAANWLWSGVLQPVFGFISAGWQALGDGLRWVYDSIIQPVLDAFGAGLTWLHDNVVAPVTSWIGDKWRLMGDGMNAVKNFVLDTVFGGLKNGLDTLQGWFRSAVDGIRAIWDGIKRATAAPVKFVVDAVYNNGIRKAWNLVAKFTGLNELEEAQLGSLGAYARGGVLPGYTPGRDPYTFIEPRTGMSIGLSGGEAIVRPEATRVLGPDWVDGINTAARVGGEKGVARFLGGFANGGVIGSITKVVRENFPMMTITSTYRPGDPGHHGTGNAVDFSNGTDTTPAMQAAAKFFHDNYGPGLFELIHSPSPFNIKNGRNVGDGFGLYGAGTMNAHRNHVHIASPNPLGDPTTFVDMADFDGAGGSWFNPMTWVKKTWDEVIDRLPSWDGPGLIGDLPAAMVKKLASAAWETVKSAVGKVAGAFTGNGGSAGSAESWRDMAMWAMRREGFNADDPAQVEAMLRQIQSESGGNPGIAQQIVDVNGTGESAGVGLLQIIPGTFAAYRDPSLPNDRRDPEANMVAALRYYKARYGTDLTTTWGHGHGYASGGVLPGYTPGRDVHQFFSPTGGALALSGGEAIMVPEWTRAVGGPAAVAAMNRAARAGRTSGGPGFADGGVFGGARGGFDAAVASLQAAASEIQAAFAGSDLGYDALAATLRNEQWAKAIVDGAAMLGKIADYNSLEGVAARSFASEMAGIAGMLGGKTVSTVASSLLGAEKQIWDARKGYADRTADIAAKEKALAEARKAAGDAASAETSEENKKRIADAEDALKKAREDGNADKVAEAEKNLADVRKEVSEKSAEDVTKANEQVAKAEQELAAARKASAQALDMRIFDVAPQINGMLLQAAAATAAVPQVSGALAGLAAVAGPAGVSVGVALQAVKVGIDTIEKVGGAIGDLVARIFDARGKTYANMVTVTNLQHEWAQMVDEQASKVAELRVAWVEAQVALRDATWKTRLAQADVVRAQLQGVKSVAEAEAKLEAERNRVARAALRNFDDLSLAYDRYRWAEYRGMVDRLDLQAAVTPEILALESEVNAARLNALASQKQASLDALRASWEQQKAALDLMQTQQNLALQTQQLAVMQREFFGMSQAESLQAMNTMKLRQELAEVQSQQGKNFWRLSYWLTGAHRADNRRERALREQIAGREGGVDSPRGADAMAFFGYGDSALNAAKNAGYGRAEQAMFEAQEQQALLQLEQQKQQLQQQIEQSRLFEQYQQQVGALTAEIESLQAGASAAQYTADYYREENTAVKAANLALARFEADRSSQYAAVGRGEKQVVEITVPQQDVYTREQMDLVLRSVQEIPELEARIRKVEAPATPGANVAMRNLIGG